MNKGIVPIIFSAIIIACTVGVANACTCMPTPSPCSSFSGTPVVFVGRVVSVKEDKVDIVRFGKKDTVRIALLANLAVEEPLKGIKVSTVDVVTGGGHGDCGYPFEAGKRYLVYAHTTQGEALTSSISRTVSGGESRMIAPLSANICSRTRPMEYATDDLELIRALNSGKPETRIFGHITQYVRKLGTYQYNTERVGPLVDVKIKAESGSDRFEGTTDRDGHFALNVKPGSYTVSVQLPEGYGPLYDFDGPTKSNVNVTAAACGVELYFNAQVDGRIGGRVFDADGSPVMDQVEVSIINLVSATKPLPQVESRSEYTKQGAYEFDGIMPGKYLIGVNIADAPDRHSPYAKVYYPNTADPAQARVFTFEAGQKIKDIDFRLAEKLIEISISGTVVRQNGTPVVEADVDIYDQEDPKDQLGLGMEVKTDRQGRFTIKAFKGRRYFLHAWKDKDYFTGTGEQSEMIPVDTNTAVPPLKLILNKQGIFINQLPQTPAAEN